MGGPAVIQGNSLFVVESQEPGQALRRSTETANQVTPLQRLWLKAPVMSLESLLTFWRNEPDIAPHIAAWHTLPPKRAQWAPFPPNLPAGLERALRTNGIDSLYAHQASSLRYARENRHFMVVTGTASGKTLCYNLPVLERLWDDPDARALYLFPTKALAQDQRTALQSLLKGAQPPTPIPVAAYDGDTPAHARPALRDRARVIFSNPDMLHVGVLPHHTQWADFFRNLAFVVLDEVHVYRGVFGSHITNVLRRLKRIAAFYGSRPRFILTSATIANPTELANRLIEAPIALVEEDGSARGPQHFLLFNPPVVNADLGIRRSALAESVRLAQDLLSHQVQTILFGGSRRAVELALSDLRRREAIAPERLRGYRSGYLPQQRRQIEAGLRSGAVRAVVATNALELGVDIGTMGAAVLAGYPGTIAGTWQQAGRAGRSEAPSLAVLVVSSNPLDQFLARHPEYFFGRSPEHALINPDNLLILLDHIRCAAFELPFEDPEPFGDVPPEQVGAFLQFLANAGDLHESDGRYFWMAERYPAADISLRSASAARILLQTDADGTWTTIGEVDRESAHWMVHPGAIYLHESEVYRVEDLDLDGGTAFLSPVSVDYFTQPRQETTVTLVEEGERAPVSGGWKAHGELSVTSQVLGYHKILWDTQERIDTLDLDMPPTDLLTTGYWIALSEDCQRELRDSGLWRNDPISYGPNWDRQRERVRARDGFRCRNCGIPERGRAHDVHHRVPFRAFPSYAEANAIGNLITLCRDCHRRAEAVVRVRSGLAGLAYTLGHLAPLHLMCDSRDLGVHTDPQSPLAEGSPAVVIFERIPAGIGFSGRLFEWHAKVMQAAEELVRRCPCEHGCPSCVGPSGEAGLGGKLETLAILEILSGG